MRNVMRVKRAWYWATCGVIGCALSVHAHAASEQITIEVGTLGLPPFAEEWFLNETALFENANPEIDVLTTNLVRPLRRDVPLHEIPRLASNVIGISQFRSELTFLRRRELIVPIDKFLPDDDFSFENFYESATEPVTVDNQRWAVPFAHSSWWLVLDWELFQAEGITSPPETWDQMIEIAKRLTKDTDNDGEVDQYGIRMPTFTYDLYYLLVAQLDRREGITHIEGEHLTFDNPTTRKNLTMIRDILYSDFCYRDSRPTIVGSENDEVKCAMQFTTSALMHQPFVVNLYTQMIHNKKYIFAPFPRTSNEMTSADIRLALAIRKSTPEQEEASWRFVKWLSRRDVSLPPIWMGFPIRKDFLQRDDVKTWMSQFCPSFEVAFTQMENSYAPNEPFALGAHRIITAHIKSYMTNEIGLDELIANLNRDVDNIIDTRAYGVDTDALFR